MTQEEIQILNSLIRSDSWKLVDRIVSEHIQKLKSIDSLDVTLDPIALKITIESRQKAGQVLSDILRDLRGYGLEVETNPLTRSFK